jgi:hypothetical protein
MPSRLRRAARRLRRALRPAVLLALVLAQGIAAFGAPVAVRGNEQRRACGCKVNGPTQACCCGTGSCCAPAAAPEPEPEEPACPHCKPKPSAKAKPAIKTVAVAWVLAEQSRKCHGDGPLGLLGDIPAVPPAVPGRVHFAASPTDRLAIADHFPTPLPQTPPIPPPRRG